MPRQPRDFKNEYARRIASGLRKGLSRSAARGHRRASEPPAGHRLAHPIEDARLQLGLRVLRREGSLSAAAQQAKISPERLRRIATEKNILERRGRRWAVRPDLPRRMLLFSNGKAVTVTVGDFDAASTIGRYMAAVSKFLRTNNPSGLGEFVDQSVADVQGKTHLFETRRNALYRMASATDQSFEQIYRIVI
jgi:hypothetical protein